MDEQGATSGASHWGRLDGMTKHGGGEGTGSLLAPGPVEHEVALESFSTQGTDNRQHSSVVSLGRCQAPF